MVKKMRNKKQFSIGKNETLCWKENGAEASTKGINGRRNIRISEATITVVHGRERQFYALLEMSGELRPTGGVYDRDFVRIIGCGSQEQV